MMTSALTGGSLLNTPRILETWVCLKRRIAPAFPNFLEISQHEGRPSNIPYRHTVEGWTVTQTIRFMEESGDQPFCVQASLPRPHECYTPDRQFWDMYSENLALPPTIHNSPAHRPPNFQAMVESLKTHQWLIEPKTFDAGCRRVWRAYLACITQVDYALGELVSYLQRSGKGQEHHRPVRLRSWCV